MTVAHRNSDDVRRAHIDSTARIRIQHLTDTGAEVVFEDANGVLCLSVAAEVFPKLVDLIQFAALSPPPPIPADAPPPNGYRPGCGQR